jgi:tight adherence protein B
MTGALLLVAGALTVGGCAAAAHFAFSSGIGPLGRIYWGYEARLERHTSFLLTSCHGAQIARLQVIVCGLSAGLLAVTQSGLCVLLVLLTAVAPPTVLWKRRASRVAKLERQLDTWLLMLANALKATSSVGEAVASTVALIPRPFSEEIDLLVKEIRLGVPLDRALSAMARRINSTVISGALSMIVVARQTGGDLPQTLERASAALREAARLEGVLRTKTAEGRGQVVVLASVPLILCVVIGSLDRTWFDPMLDHHQGRAVLALCLVAWALASLWAHHIVRADL